MIFRKKKRKKLTKEIELRSGIIELLSQEKTMVLKLALCYARNYEKFGIDVVNDWITATRNQASLNTAYLKGVYDGIDQERKGWEYRCKKCCWNKEE